MGGTQEMICDQVDVLGDQLQVLSESFDQALDCVVSGLMCSRVCQVQRQQQVMQSDRHALGARMLVRFHR